MNTYENKIQTAIIMGLTTDDKRFTKYDKEEMISLAAACDIEVVGLIEQNLHQRDPNFLVGPGKIHEVIQMAEELEVDYIIANQDISARQIRNIDEFTDTIPLDRNMLILEIFTRRAQSRSAQLQVEIAKINYELPRLVGSSDHLSKQAGSTGGGLANRGAGETKLELERRELNNMLTRHRRELETLVKQQETQSKQRDKSDIFRVSLVGYTNAGKSTIMNGILNRNLDNDKQVFVKDMLFATLDTSTRRIEVDEIPPFLLSDTVGFVNDLPHTLIEAFRSTLQEVIDSDLLLHVVDISNPDHKQQKEITENTLKEIGADQIPIINILNKADLVDDDITYPNSYTISAMEDEGIQAVLDIIQNEMMKDFSLITLHIPYQDGAILNEILTNTKSEIIDQDEVGQKVEAHLSKDIQKKYKKYII